LLQQCSGIRRSVLQCPRGLRHALLQRRRAVRESRRRPLPFRQRPPMRWMILAIRGEAKHGRPDITDHALNLVGRGRHPVASKAFSYDAARALQAQPHGKQPVHHVSRELAHRVPQKCLLPSRPAPAAVPAITRSGRGSHPATLARQPARPPSDPGRSWLPPMNMSSSLRIRPCIGPAIASPVSLAAEDQKRRAAGVHSGNPTWTPRTQKIWN